MAFPWILVIFFLFGLPIKFLKAETLRVAVASNFLKTAQGLALKFESQTQHKIQLSSASSGKLYLQISKGAPFDLFLSADTHKPQELIKNQLAQPESLQTYALGKLVVWLKFCSKAVDLNYLASNDVQKLAIANPKLAPYGFASKQFLLSKQLWDRLEPKMVYPENISQVSQLAKLGVVDAAIVAESHKNELASKPPSCFIDISINDYPAINQQLVILSNSQHKRLAQEFVEFMKSYTGQNLIKNMGYLLPDSDKIAPIK